jgi:DNA polymerase III sliding clamp (beta) subunit (PCNA family)
MNTAQEQEMEAQAQEVCDEMSAEQQEEAEADARAEKLAFDAEQERSRTPYLRADFLEPSFYTMIAAAQQLTDEPILSFNKEGITIQQLDPSGISMIKATLAAKHIQKYELSKEEISVSFNAENYIKLADPEPQSITTDTAHIIFSSKGEAFNLPLLSNESRIQSPPKTEFKSKIVMQAANLKEIIKKAESVSSYITITATQQSIAFSARGESGEFSRTLGRGATTSFFVNGTEQRAQFNIDYIKHFLKTAKKDTLISLAIQSEEPLFMSYAINGVELAYWLAPYMES